MVSLHVLAVRVGVRRGLLAARELLALLETALPIDDVVRLLSPWRDHRVVAVDTNRRREARRRGTGHATNGLGTPLPELDDRGGRLFLVLTFQARSLRV